ncbi:polysaccharide pyruvyl transferase family protein [Ornithinimicrobium panacihumi]|uniref:polysaccharide pyruvyl transferase family protein n=1 Tax=Ornithinimicrobium panacihumi TaxID=2008449 RepID=UPI003F8B7C59
MIAVAGCYPRMPQKFPLDMDENSGNMIHARAPQRILGEDKTVEYHTMRWSLAGEKSYADFVNKHCNHLVISMTNTIKVNSGIKDKYVRFQRMLELYDVPITIFGLGVRSPVDDLSEATIPDEAITMLRYMEERCGPIGVRGEFTKKVFEELAGVTNVQVTGCPSFFSEPAAFSALRRQLANPQPGTYTYSGTKYERAAERAQFLRIVKGDGIYIEPTHRGNHRAHLQALKGKPIDIPDFLTANNHVATEDPAPRGRRGIVGRLLGPRESAPPTGQVTRQELTDFYRNRYRLWRDPDQWLQFNREVVAFGFGTRFHVNMATVLAGKPATWITHDTRTREFCDFLHLPHVSLEDSAEMEPQDFRAAANYDALFDHLPALFDNWASYLEAHNLPYSRPKLP